MSLEYNICKKLNSLKPTTTIIYCNNGDVYQEARNTNGELRTTKLNTSSPGFVIDHVPDLSVSKILPWLCLGSQDVAQDHELLISNNITHVLSIGIPSPNYDDITSTFIQAYDIDEFQIVDIFEQSFGVINYVKDTSGIVYIHCNAGVSRSPTIVTAYLMQHYKITPETALNIVRKVRPKINPNRGFLKQLEEFYKTLTLQT